MSIYDILSNGICIVEAIKQRDRNYSAYWNNLPNISPFVTEAYISRDKFTMYDDCANIVVKYCSVTTPFMNFGSRIDKMGCLCDLTEHNWLSDTDDCPIMILNNSFDCLAHISRFFSIQDIMNMRLSCKGFVKGFSSESVWRPILNTIKDNANGYILYDSIPTSMAQVTRYLLYTNDHKVIEHVLNNDPKATELLASVFNYKAFRRKRKRGSEPVIVRSRSKTNISKARVAIGFPNAREGGPIWADMWITVRGNIRVGTRHLKDKHLKQNVLNHIRGYQTRLLKNE